MGGGEREKHQSVASHVCPKWGPNSQPWYVPSPGMEPTIFWCVECYQNKRLLGILEIECLTTEYPGKPKR